MIRSLVPLLPFENAWKVANSIGAEFAGSFAEQEARLVYSALRECMTPGGTVVELGSLLGRSTAFFSICAESVDGWAITFDNLSYYGRLQLTEFKTNMSRAGVRPILAIGDTHQIDVRSLCHDGACFLYVDADHGYEAVAEDCVMWLPVVNPSGMVAFHDIDNEQVASAASRECAGWGEFGRTERLLILRKPRQVWPQGAASEVAKCRNRLAGFCQGAGVDLGCRNEKITPRAIGIDKKPSEATNIVGDISRLPWFGDCSLGYVFSSHALEHLPDPATALREWLRVLKPGGAIVLYLPDSRWYTAENPEHLSAWTLPGFLRFAAEAIGNEAEIIHSRECPPRTEGKNGAVIETGEYSFEVVARKISRSATAEMR